MSTELTQAEILATMQNALTVQENLKSIIERMKPAYEFGRFVMEDDRTYSMQEAAKALFVATGLGPNQLFAWLRDEEILIGRHQHERSHWHNQPYQRYVDCGYFEMKLSRTGVGPIKRTVVTGRGMQWILKRWRETHDELPWGIEEARG